jgi:hypothetical protein
MWDFFAIVGPMALGIGAAIVTLFPARLTAMTDEARMLWAMGFAVLGLFTAFATWQAQSEQETKLKRDMTGGDCFASFSVSRGDPSLNIKDGPPYPLFFEGACATLYDVSVQIMNIAADATPEQEILAYKNAIFERKQTMQWPYDTGILLWPGRYAMNIWARNGLSGEILNLPPEGPEKQHIKVFKYSLDGLIILKCLPAGSCQSDDDNPWEGVVPAL